MASRAQSKSKKAKAKTPAKKSPRSARPASARPATGRTPGKASAAPAVYVPRAMPAADEDDYLMAVGAGGGAGFGRCGGRVLGSRLEQTLCDRLSQVGVAHSHAPRHFEVQLGEKRVGAYAPMVVLRGRGREGKSVVLEATEQAENPILRKMVAFRSQYGQEFYLILVAPEEVLDEVPVAGYDESCSTTGLNALISRLAE